jgi:hypothetical protein
VNFLSASLFDLIEYADALSEARAVFDEIKSSHGFLDVDDLLGYLAKAYQLSIDRLID